MKTDISRDTIRDLKNGTLQAVAGDTIHDNSLKGFCIRVRPAGRFFYIVKRIGSRVAFVKIGDVELMTAGEAREQAKQALARITLGDAPAQAVKRKEKTLLDFLDGSYADYLATRQKNPARTIASMKSAFKSLLDTDLGKFTAVMVDRWQGTFIKSGRKPATANRAMNDLRACFAYAEGRGLIEKNPLKIVKRVQEAGDHIVRYLSPDEENALRTALDEREDEKRAARESGNEWRIERNHDSRADLRLVQYVDHLKPAILLAMNTGLRQGEQFALTWKNVDLKKGLLTVRAETAKANKTRHIPLNAEARAVLTEWKKQVPDSGYVFPGKEDGKPLVEIKTAFSRLLKRADIGNFRWHDMRHHFASRLVMAGVDLNTVRELLGHADLTMTLRYAHLAPEHKAAAVELISGMPARA
jgi:integrase